MSIILTAVKGLTLGLVMFFGVGVVASILPSRFRTKVSDFYLGLAMDLLGRAVLMRRSHGGHMLKRTSYDASAGGEKAIIGGETKHWKDGYNFMSTFQGKPFGLVHEDSNVVVNARVIHLAREYRNLKQKGDWIVKGHRKSFFTLEEGKTYLVEIADVLPCIQTSESPGLVDRLDTYVEKMYADYNSSPAMEFIPWLMGLGAGFFLMFMAAKLSEQTSASGVVPI